MTKRAQVLLAVLAFAVALCPRIGVLALLQRGIDEARVGLITPGNMTARERLIELGSTVVLGSFRTVAVAFLWTRATVLKDRREHVELDGVIRLIAKFQPTDIDAQTHQIWNMAYNVQYDAPNVVTAWSWVKRALEFGERAIRRNVHHPRVWKLYWQIGWVYSHRCADVGDKRTEYFQKQVEKSVNEGGQGKHPYLVAADWYEKAFHAALQTEAKSSFVAHRISMWAYAYANLARQLEKRGDIDGMICYRKKAVEVHQRLMDTFGDAYLRDGQEKVAELEELIALHERAREAEQLKDKPDEAVRKWLHVAQGWAAIAQKHPDQEEALRNADRAADAIEAVAERLTDASARDDALLEAMKTRYWAAPLRRGLSAATDALERSAARLDRALDAITSARSLAEKHDLVWWVARAQARVAILSRTDKNRLDGAAASLTRYHSILDFLDADQRASAMQRLIDLWVPLLNLTDLDSSLGRNYVRQTAEAHENQLLPLCAEITRLLTELLRLGEQTPAAEQQRLIGEILPRRQAACYLADRAVEYWAVLLRRDKPYADVAPVAQKHLEAIANAIDALARAGGDHIRHPQDSRMFSSTARNAWRILHEYEPDNATYKEKSRPPERPAPRRVHEHHH